MADEIELKLALPESAQALLLRQSLLKESVARRTGQLVNLYYDTPDFALRRHGVALRLRQEHGAWLQTVKCAGSGGGGLTARPEWETPYGGRFDFSSVDDEDVRRWLERPDILSRLAPIFETSFRRTIWRFEPEPGSRLLLMFDRGWIASNGRREIVSELEIELDGGRIGRIFALARHLAEKVPLAPALLSKAERGYRLYQGIPMAPVKAADIPLQAELPPLDAFRRIALACLDHLQYNHPGALASDDPEYIHQMRVATRRLRAALRLFAPLLSADFSAGLLPPLRELMGLLGHARDLDVLQAEIVAPVIRALPGEPRLSTLAGIITDRRYAARSAAVQTLRSPRYGQMILQAAALLHEPDGSPGNTTIAAFAGNRLKRLHEKVRRLAQSARQDDPLALHALRIGCKRLRYALEFFGPLAPKKSVRRAATRLENAQDALGQLNDLANAGRLLMDCAGGDARLREAVTLIGGWHGPRHAQLLAGMPALIEGLHDLRLPRLVKSCRNTPSLP
ncbi:MAG: CHAD domain-containing protein [Candidatus Nitricoxidivorans perseverans]|uniref:CHAD domain-containing protein n=1 Tax=Candidatus Nitricoxidivorans perseverans TaxID=2975601 RepID=A0AA49FL45_9PROT|nr:MAG: CHAD domain-containing protein [Candidatus Nitricoxidivorans perseverans]